MNLQEQMHVWRNRPWRSGQLDGSKATSGLAPYYVQLSCSDGLAIAFAVVTASGERGALDAALRHAMRERLLRTGDFVEWASMPASGEALNDVETVRVLRRRRFDPDYQAPDLMKPDALSKRRPVTARRSDPQPVVIPLGAEDSFERYLPPSTRRIPLEVPPALDSWDKAGSDSQSRLAEFLDHVDSVAKWPLGSGPVVLGLHVTLPSHVPLLEQHDADNYLSPVARRLVRPGLLAAFASKSHTGMSGIWLELARRAGPLPKDWTFIYARSDGAAGDDAWKHKIREQVEAQSAQAPEGPVHVGIAWRIGTGRQCLNLWKPTIDTLGPVLGETYPDRVFNPRDGRITRLALSWSTVRNFGDRVEIGIWWRRESAAHDT